ncbi:MAG: hypothetical protein A2958_03250 [Candidatus Levybacteria bacterium RIFCSPLOWO2_01_FULL_38_13]|nr:MAG: hypothetical protein A2629_03665 [Candidatus Levybacteria bacterium RIFCSPHIGHO2_01_FULL_41_15]OGH35331.1 MAG: hypothetical protein A2958_03250 [Candidatus Levybacteria bacterium RIFCSPLOWO2_01_FULL_38_13]
MRPVIGLEVHVELRTKSKMFCGCSADYFGQKPNTHTCPVCLGLPGALPVPNKTAIEWCIMLGMALNCNIPLLSKFDRKNYFYPDLPKGYQISQYDEPFAINGYIDLSSKISNPKSQINSKSKNKNFKRIRIRRVHMEEDTGKLIHETINGEDITLIDFNRSGVPLVEIVTEPDFENPEDVKEYLQRLQQIVRYLNISNADMEKGDMRLEPNISLRSNNTSTTNTTKKQMSQLPSYKVEVKNINSFRFVEKAIDYEIKRQKGIIESGKIPIQETRGWDDNKQKTVSQRVKEEESDYRYFPEPDIPPLRWAKNQLLNIKKQIPELPEVKMERFSKEYKIKKYDSEILIRNKEEAEYFEEAVRVGKKHNVGPQLIANFIINRKQDIKKDTLPAELIKTIKFKTSYVKADEEEVKKSVQEVLRKNPQAAEDYRKGKTQALQFLIGKTIALLKEKVEPQLIIGLINEQLK